MLCSLIFSIFEMQLCVKNFDFTKHKHEACDGKCLKAFEKVEARTKIEIEKAQCKLLMYLFNFNKTNNYNNYFLN